MFRHTLPTLVILMLLLTSPGLTVAASTPVTSPDGTTAAQPTN